MKKKKGRPSEYKGSKVGKLMRDFDMKFSDALALHFQDKRYMENQHVKKQKAEQN